SAVTEFIDKYNEIVEYVNENDTITREESGAEIETIFGPLASTRIDDGLLSAIRSTIVGSRHLSPDEDNPTNRYRIFADLGIATERDGTLSIDSDEFQEALAGEPDSVDNILQNFANETAKTGKLFEQYLRFNGGGAGGGLFQGATKNNEERIESLNDEIARAEEFIDNEANQIRARFARLEATISRLQNQQAALTSALAGLNA
ncbi:flagellar filament capping protein FliD, partial [bacterium]|nr:flagellar filament capping protein FliD [bacterium]